MDANGVETIPVTCVINGEKIPVRFHVGSPTPFLSSNPIHFQMAWILQERGVALPVGVAAGVQLAMSMARRRAQPLDSAWKLWEIADENSVSYEDLAQYAYPALEPAAE